MKAKLLHEGDEKTYALIFATGDEVMSGLLAFAKEQGLAGSRFTAIGGFSSATLGYFEWTTKQYKQIPVNEQVEVLTLAGDIALDQGAPKVHAHVILGRSDATTLGGHLIEAQVRPTLEVVLEESPVHLRRRMDSASGIALIDL